MGHSAIPLNFKKSIKSETTDAVTEEVKYIDLERIIANKNPKLLKLMPAIFLRYLKRIVHEDDMNGFLLRTKENYDHDFLNATIKDFEIQLSSTGLENIPKSGGCIVVCNHPLGGIDGIAVMNEVAKVRKDIRAMVNDILMNLKNLSNLMIPVNKHGKNVGDAVKMIDQAYASGECIIVFPAGLVSRKMDGKIQDLEWKKSFITKAIKYELNVVPVFVNARNSNFFYNLALLRKKIGIKANLEMFYLVNETFKQRGKSIKLTFGEPISHVSFTKEQNDHYWAQKVKEHVYKLEKGNQLF